MGKGKRNRQAKAQAAQDDAEMFDSAVEHMTGYIMGLLSGDFRLRPELEQLADDRICTGTSLGKMSGAQTRAFGRRFQDVGARRRKQEIDKKLRGGKG